VIFTGPERDREKLRAWNTRADLFLFPSTYDTNGIVVREAAACGLGSVLIKGSCAAEGITDGRNGFLIEETAESMAALLKEVSGQRDKMKDVGQHAMDEIYISWDDSVAAAYERYSEIRDLVAEGKIVRRKPHGSDILLKSASALAMETMHLFDLPRNIYGGMRENLEEDFDEFKEELRDNLEEMRDRLPDSVKEFSDNAKAFGDKTKEEIRKRIEQL
jgi:hypothetical protein